LIFVQLESHVGELKGEVKIINARLNESMIANAREFGSVKTDGEEILDAKI
jgi:hypothetical protein